MPRGEPTLNVWHLLAVLWAYGLLAAALVAWIWLIRRRRKLGPSAVPFGRRLAESIGVRPGQVPVWPAAVFGIVLGVYFLSQVIVVGAYEVASTLRQAEPEAMGGRGSVATLVQRAASGAIRGRLGDARVVMGLGTVAYLLFAALTWLFLKRIRRARVTQQATGGGTIAADVRFGLLSALIAGPVVYGVMALAIQLWPPIEHPVMESIKLKQGGAGAAALLAIVSAVVAAPLAEELLFRGALLGWLTTLAWKLRRRFTSAVHDVESWSSEETVSSGSLADSDIPAWHEAGVPGRRDDFWTFWIPNVLSSAIFALLHYQQWPAPVPLFVLSLTLGWLVRETGRLTAAVAAHAAFNAFSTVLALLLMQGGPIQPAPPAPPAPAPLVRPEAGEDVTYAIERVGKPRIGVA